MRSTAATHSPTSPALEFPAPVTPASENVSSEPANKVAMIKSAPIRLVETSTTVNAADKSSALPAGFVARSDGIYVLEPDEADAEGVWLCSPFQVKAIGPDVSGGNWGKLVELTDPDGRTKELVIPATSIFGTATKALALMSDQGFEITHMMEVRRAFPRLLQEWKPAARYTLADKFGWLDDSWSSFVIGSGRVLGGKQVRSRFDSNHSVARELVAVGNFGEWRNTVAARCIDNPILVLVVSMAFAGPLLEPLGMDGGGIHLSGASASGKSTVLRIAASVWGSPRFVQTWRATSNGLEGVAAVCNGTLLALDELAEVSAAEVGSAIYMLANGAGKSRAHPSCLAPRSVRWRTILLSSGEITLAQKLAESGRTVMAGQEMRLIGLKAVTGTAGVFEHLHGFATGADFARELNTAASKKYGTAGPAFVNGLIQQPDKAFRASELLKRKFLAEARAEFSLKTAGQTSRVVERFAIIAAAGELATLFGITGWPKGTAFKAVKHFLGQWLDDQESHDGAVTGEAVERVANYLADGGSHHFQMLGACTASSCAGWRDADNFYILPETWRVIYGARNATTAANLLRNSGYLIAKDGSNLTTKAPRAIPERPRVYVVRSAILDKATVTTAPRGSTDPEALHPAES